MMPPHKHSCRLTLAFAIGLFGCAKAQLGTADLSATGGDGGRTADLAGTDLQQIEAHDLGLCGSCDDSIACTNDVCLPTGTCAHVPDHGKCTDRQVCTTAGCIAIDASKLCATCAADPGCGLDELCTTLPAGDLGMKSFCLPRCGAGSSCPKGFSCDTTRSRCTPVLGSAPCCYDGDSDQYGVGAGCLGTDCDDADPTVYSGHPEICDGKDNNCDGNKDEGTLCGGATCGPLGTTGTFSGTAVPACVAGACQASAAVSCAKYTCMSVTAPVAGNACRVGCSAIDDSACVAAAYCDGAACQAQVANGGVCTRDRMCGSGHCQNGHCCASGDCCNVAADCPAGAYATPAACDAPPTSCQGHRDDPSCTAQKTCAKLRVDDDSACGSSISIDCTPLAAQSCSGTPTQSPLACPTTCTTDGQCVASAYCNGSTCVAKKPDGSACAADNQCATAHHCITGFCCNAVSGACCGQASDCPASYAAPAACDTPLVSCQGHRIDKVCGGSICGSVNVDDDSACSPSISKSCSAYAAVSCIGVANQSPLQCPTSCVTDGECVQPANHCLGGTCQPWVENGGGCGSSAQCRGGNCVDGVCCQSACNATSCDTCGGGSCMPFVDPLEAGNICLPSLPDLGSGAFTASVSAYLQSATDDEDWYQFFATDASNFCTGFIHVQLTVPAGVDYDVYLYSSADGSCGTTSLLVAGLSASGNEDVRYFESCALSDAGWYLVRVRRYAGQSCTLPYTLTVDARL